mgnify:CR=1 FL=1
MSKENDRLGPVVLCIMDGWGYRESRKSNAVALANTPNFDRLCNQYPSSFLVAAGPDVGLPEGQVGSSEVGHMNIGAGRIVMQDLPRINQATADGSLAAHPLLSVLAKQLTATGRTAHIMGLLSNGGVHSHQDHILAIIRTLCDSGVNVVIHGFTDGRDVLPKIARQSIADFARELPDNSVIATITGRYFAMDRDKRWDRTKCAFDAIISASVEKEPYTSVSDAITDAYDSNESDEFIRPRVVGTYAGMQDGDALICTNFRADRVQQLLNAMLLPETVGFDAEPPSISTAISMTAYSDSLSSCMQTLFPPLKLTKTLGEVVASAGRRQLRLAETEKYPHVTFFFNGGDEKSQPNEHHYMVQSPMVATYDQQPEMNAEGVLTAALESINTHQHDLIVVNFANPDMVGHTGNLQAAITAVEIVDDCVGQIAVALVRAGGQMLVTADHGNCEVMWDDQANSPHTAHTTNLVPLILVNGKPSADIADGRLADLAPSVLEMLGIIKPDEMTGKSLLR